MSSAQSDNSQPLSMLAMSLMEADETPNAASYMDHHHHHVAEEGGCRGWVAFLFYFLVLALIFYFLYFALRPSFVLNNDDCSDSRSFSDDHFREINNGKLLGAAILSALVLIFICWLFAWLAGAY